MNTTITIFKRLLVLFVVIIITIACNKVDNSELCQWRVMFINNGDEMVEVHMTETGSVFEIKPHDSINYSESVGQPTLTMTYKAFIYPDNHQQFICERNVSERNVINYNN
jgi:hypothetical protein